MESKKKCYKYWSNEEQKKFVVLMQDFGKNYKCYEKYFPERNYN